ncbi:MAG TPA: HAD family hydrolase [Bacilli bacterium]|nr:HAD family hydrolase [Bacilli bacterium]
MKQHLLFDLDDTLIHCNRFFNEAREEFLEAMRRFFGEHPIDIKMVDETQQKIDLSGIEQFGLGKHRFPESLITTYRLMCEKFHKHRDEREEEELQSIGYGVYTREIEMYPHAHETLKKLRDQGHELYLYTGGDKEIQTGKVLRAGLADIFPPHRRIVSEHKNRDVLRSILDEHNLEHEHTWMVGNSARNDIRPALEEGIHAIHLPDKGGWAFDEADLNVQNKGRFVTLESIRHVPDVIDKHIEDKKSGAKG